MGYGLTGLEFQLVMNYDYRVSFYQFVPFSSIKYDTNISQVVITTLRRLEMVN